MRFLLIVLLLAAGPRLAAAQALVRQPLPLQAVTLYLDGGCELRHGGSVSLPAGAVDVQVLGLAQGLSSSNMQAEVSGAELQGLEVLTSSPQRTDTLARLSHEQAVLAAEKEFLQQNVHSLAATPGAWVADVQRGATYYSTRLVQINERLRVIEGQASANPNPQQVLLHLQVPQAGPVRLRLSYQTNSQASSAYWSATYELRAEEGNLSQLRVVSRAVLHNATGLAWTNLPVTLRTASPSADLTRPSLDPWAVAFGRAGNEGEGNLNDFAVRAPATPGAGSTPGAPTEAPGLGTSLRLPAPVTLASGTSHTYRLGDYTLPMRLEYLAVPKQEDEVFLVGRVSDWNQVNFLAETATVFYRGAYVGATTLDTRAYSDTLEVALGRDPQVQLTRTKREDYARTSLGREKTRLAYEINVKNTHPYPVRLRLLDQVPVSQEKDISVKVLDVGGATLDEPSGRLTWLLGLPAGVSRKFPIVFTVEAPAGKAINLRRDRRIHNPKFR